MQPLSLSTFAHAELYGVGLDRLVSPNVDEQLEAWIGLYALLSRITPEEAADELGRSPESLVAFTEVVQRSLEPQETPDAKPNHRRTKDPREVIASLSGATMKSSQGTDYSMLIELSRFAGVPLSDIYQMTFRGLSALSESIKANPPQPKLF